MIDSSGSKPIRLIAIYCLLIAFWCERGDSNPHTFRYQILSLARLPIPPLSLNFKSEKKNSTGEREKQKTGHRREETEIRCLLLSPVFCILYPVLRYAVGDLLLAEEVFPGFFPD